MSEMQRDGSEMRCKRCGANESRIHGFCSVECEHYFDYEEEITDLNARIAELEAEQRWIPVSERLPEEKQNVLALDRTGTAYHWEYSRSLSNIFVSDYTHWMPLPKLPEVQE